MSDYKELLERADEWKPSDAWRIVVDLSAALRAVIAERDATESERKHWEMTAGTLRTDLEYMTRRAEQAEARLAEYERFYSNPENWKREKELDANSGNFTGGPAAISKGGKPAP